MNKKATGTLLWRALDRKSYEYKIARRRNSMSAYRGRIGGVRSSLKLMDTPSQFEPGGGIDTIFDRASRQDYISRRVDGGAGILAGIEAFRLANKCGQDVSSEQSNLSERKID